MGVHSLPRYLAWAGLRPGMGAQADKPLQVTCFSVLNVKPLVGAFNKEKTLVGTFSGEIFAKLRLKL